MFLFDAVRFMKVYVFSLGINSLIYKKKHGSNRSMEIALAQWGAVKNQWLRYANLPQLDAFPRESAKQIV